MGERCPKCGEYCFYETDYGYECEACGLVKVTTLWKVCPVCKKQTMAKGKCYNCMLKRSQSKERI